MTFSSRYHSKIKSPPKTPLTHSNSDSQIIYVTPATTSERPLETEHSHYSPPHVEYDLSSADYYRVKVTTFAPNEEYRKKIQAATSVNNVEIDAINNFEEDDNISSPIPSPPPSHSDDIYLTSSEIPEELVKLAQPPKTHKIVKVLSNNAIAVAKVKKPHSNDYDYSNDEDDGELIKS